jgi:hypothetical protein
MSEMKFFSTKFTVKMMGARYIPSVCYPINDIIRPTITALAEKDEVRLYPEKVRFVNGVAIPAKKKEAAKADTAKTEAEDGKIGRKKGRKDFD